MDWQKERDELIAQTLAFVQSVNAQIPAPFEPARTEPRLAPTPPHRPQPEANGVPHALPTPLPAVTPNAPPPSARLPRPSVHSEIEEEFRTRIARFRAHQERFNRERAEYFDATIARLRATLEDPSPPPAGRITQP